jgi:NAD(P)-dependent dehydrogenase (short-subunit alcohol dehydrogenase family)
VSSVSRTWLITDASRRFGRELTNTVLADGDRVVAVARPPGLLAGMLRVYGDRLHVVPLDVTDGSAARAAVQAAVDEFGRLDVVVNNAGHAESRSKEGAGDEDVRAQIATNLFGVVTVTKAALPVLCRQRAGHIIQFSTMRRRADGARGFAAHQASRCALEGFSEVLHDEVKPYGIKVTIVEPAAFDADLGGSSLPSRPASRGHDPTNKRVIHYRAAGAGARRDASGLMARAVLDVVRLDEPPLRLVLASGRRSVTPRNHPALLQRQPPSAGRKQRPEADA